MPDKAIILPQHTSAPAGDIQQLSAQNAYFKKNDTAPKKTTPNIRCLQTKLTMGAPNDPYEKEADTVAENVMRMADENFLQRKCADCEEEEKAQRKLLPVSTTPFLQTKSENIARVSEGVDSAIQCSRGSGSSIDSDTQSFMSSRMGSDFSDVKIHTDRQSEQLNHNLSARAFTVGNDIYFNRGEYEPQSSEGKQLLAHELTHVIQQRGNIRTKLIQRVCHEDTNPSRTLAACPEGATDVGRQLQGQTNALDTRANAIIAIAAGTGSNSAKALQVVNDMICVYMPSQASKVRKINYYSAEPGLAVQSIGAGATTRGDICVGDTFLTGTTRTHLSRRLLQLAHELEHIDQYRTGLAGQNNRPLREFLAFYHEALADEFIGTRRMSDNTRKGLIDAALGQYNCFSTALQTTHQSKQQELLTRRQTVNGTSGNDPTSPPTACVPR